MGNVTKHVAITARQRRKYRSRRKGVIGSVARPRVCVYKSAKYTYAQLVYDGTGETIAWASTREKEVLEAVSRVKEEGFHSNVTTPKSVRAARALGLVLAERAKAKDVPKVVFDRNGFLYHGRVQAVAEGLREGGLPM